MNRVTACRLNRPIEDGEPFIITGSKSAIGVGLALQGSSNTGVRFSETCVGFIEDEPGKPQFGGNEHLSENSLSVTNEKDIYQRIQHDYDIVGKTAVLMHFKDQN